MSQRGPVVSGVIGAVVAVLVVVFLIVPKSSAVRDTNTKVDAARQQQSVLEGQLAQLKDTASRAKQYRKQLQTLEAQVPPTADLPGLIRLLNSTADQSAVDFISIAPGQQAVAAPGGGLSVTGPVAPTPSVSPSVSPSPSPSASPTTSVTGTTGTVPGAAPTSAMSVSQVPITITVQGTFFAVDEYLFRLETLPRASKVTNLSLAPLATGTATEGVSPELTLTIQVNFFTTDTNAGPGSEPGTQAGGAASTTTGASTVASP
jgi:Tfp pilus assembly protein PilO